MLWVIIFFGGVALAWLTVDALRTRRDDGRGWSVWVRDPFFRYLRKDAHGAWASIDFDVIWERHGHGSTLKAIRIPPPTNWFSAPDWAVARRDEIVANLREAYPDGVDFIVGEPDSEHWRRRISEVASYAARARQSGADVRIY